MSNYQVIRTLSSSLSWIISVLSFLLGVSCVQASDVEVPGVLRYAQKYESKEHNVHDYHENKRTKQGQDMSNKTNLSVQSEIKSGASFLSSAELKRQQVVLERMLKQLREENHQLREKMKLQKARAIVSTEKIQELALLKKRLQTKKIYLKKHWSRSTRKSRH